MNIYLDLFLTFMRIGAFTFGGGYAMLSLLGHECVDKKHWISRDEMLDITVLAESTPGPIAINCATYTGYKRAGVKGALAATVGMVIPSLIVIYIISCFLDNLLEYRIVSNAFKGIRIAIAILIIQAAYKMLRDVLKNNEHKISRIIIICVFGTVVIAGNFAGVTISTIYLIIISGIVGYVLYGGDRSI